MAAVTWPAALLSVSQVIDNPWSVALQRAVAAGRQLAEVLLGREQVLAVSWFKQNFTHSS